MASVADSSPASRSMTFFEHGFGGGLLVGLLCRVVRCLPVTTWAVLASRPRLMPTYRDCRDRVSVTSRWAVSTVRPWATCTLPA